MNANEQIVFNELKRQGFTIESIAAIMGVCGQESQFTDLSENGYCFTPASSIRVIFGLNMSDADINAIKCNDRAFFDRVYGGRYGNAPDEGYKYRGRGFNQITFKSNYENIRNKTGIDVVSNPDLLERPDVAAKALAVYFDTVKNIRNFDESFKLSLRLNAGIANSYEYYANSSNPVIRQAVVLKKQKAIEYYRLFGSGNSFLDNTGNGLTVSVFIPVFAVVYFAYKYLIKR
jgi:predicted chitinase